MIRKLVGILASRWEVLSQQFTGGFDGGDQSLLILATSEVVGKVANDILPGFLRDLLVDGIVGNQSSKVFGEGYVDEQTSAPLGGVKVLRKEFLDGSLMRLGTLHRFRHESKTKRLPQNKREAEREDHELGGINLLHGPIGEQDEWQRHAERDECRPQNANGKVARRCTGDDDDDLATRFLLCAGDSFFDRCPLTCV